MENRFVPTDPIRTSQGARAATSNRIARPEYNDAPAAVPAPRSLSAAGLTFIKSWESFRATLHNDAGGHCTIGYGTMLHAGCCDGRPVEQAYADGIDEAQASRLLTERMAQSQQVVNERVKTPLGQNQNDALVSFASEIGGAAFETSTLLRLLNTGDVAVVPVEMRKWIRARQQGVVSARPALAKRRAAEAELFAKRDAPSSLGHVLPGKSGTAVTRPISHSYSYESPGTAQWSRAQNPVAVVIAGMEVADAAQVGLAAAAMVQAQVASSQGSFTLSFDKAERMLSNEARQAMPGARSVKSKYQRLALHLPKVRAGTAHADVIVEWEGNAYGEIGTVLIQRDLANSTEFSKSAANITMTWLRQIPIDGVDPRAWPIVYAYAGTYDPMGNGYWEFNGELELNAFGGIKWNKHQVFSRSFADATLGGAPADWVQRGPDIVIALPVIPDDQVAYLRTHLP